MPGAPGRVRPWQLIFTADATSIINGAEPATGRRTIAEDMGAFFVEFPDLVLFMDDLRCGGIQAIYPWALEGAHRETGKFLRIPGWQRMAELAFLGRSAYFPCRPGL